MRCILCRRLHELITPIFTVQTVYRVTDSDAMLGLMWLFYKREKLEACDLG